MDLLSTTSQSYFKLGSLPSLAVLATIIPNRWIDALTRSPVERFENILALAGLI
jgi:hypothetical protein